MNIIIGRGENVEFADAKLSYLEELLCSIDRSLLSVNDKIQKADVWGVGCYCDKGEYFIGVGFCAMQRYLFDVLEDVKLDPGLARTLGPKSSIGIPVAEVIHAAGNYWKHSPEWHIWLEKLRLCSQKTVDSILHGKESADYPLSDLLVELVGGDFRLSNCLPYLIKWHLAVHQYVQKKV